MRQLKLLLRSKNSQVLLSNSLASAIGLLTFLLMTRITEPSEFGKVVIFFSLAGLADLIRTGFIRQGLVRQWINTDKQNQAGLIGSVWLLHFLLMIVIGLVCVLVDQITYLLTTDIEIFSFFFQFYPFLLFASVPHQMLSWFAQSRAKYLRMNTYRLIVNFIVLALLSFQYGNVLTAQELIMCFVFANVIVSFVGIIDDRSYEKIVQANRQTVRQLFVFGKYSMSTLAGSNLLKSTDTILIGWMMNPEAAALYAIPLKVLEVVEIPLRGFVMTSYHRLTSYVQQKNRLGYRIHFKSSALRLTLLGLPVSLVCLFLPLPILTVLGGEGYTEGISILQLLSFVILLMPLDKYTGMSLDSINQPRINATKVWIMVLINVIGDWIVLRLNGPLWMIALVTALNILCGIFFGLIKNPYIRDRKEVRSPVPSRLATAPIIEA